MASVTRRDVGCLLDGRYPQDLLALTNLRDRLQETKESMDDLNQLTAFHTSIVGRRYGFLSVKPRAFCARHLARINKLILAAGYVAEMPAAMERGGPAAAG